MLWWKVTSCKYVIPPPAISFTPPFFPCSHKEQLDELKVADPEFYSFLLENDEKLLDFSGSENELSEDELGEDSDCEQRTSEADTQDSGSDQVM